MYLPFFFLAIKSDQVQNFPLGNNGQSQIVNAFGIERSELICLHQLQLHKAFPIQPQALCGSPAQTQHPGQHSRGSATMESTLQLGHFQPAQVHILT